MAVSVVFKNVTLLFYSQNSPLELPQGFEPSERVILPTQPLKQSLLVCMGTSLNRRRQLTCYSYNLVTVFINMTSS